jgi:hypothetical protein
VWDVLGESYALAANLSGHDDPVWQVTIKTTTIERKRGRQTGRQTTLSQKQE